MFRKINATYIEFPRSFWILVGGSFIDRLGGALIFPFLSLYIADRFHVGMTEIGLLLGVWSVSGLIGSIIGGAMTDKFGRRFMLIFGLVFSALTALGLGFVNDLNSFFLVIAGAGVLSDIGGPAQNAIVADLLPEKQRGEGYGILRVASNLAVTFGPAIGGVLAGISYLLLFIIDAFASVITAAIVFFALPETKPNLKADHKSESMVTTIINYRKIIKDRLFVAFIGVTMTMVIVYTQMYSTLSVFLNKVHGVSPQGFGYLMSMNALMVVVMQFWITRKIKKYEPMFLMIAATALYGIGYTMFGFVSVYPLFMLAMAIITVGEMLHIPTAQSLVARFAPADMRGRYMAAYGLGWAVPNSIGFLLAGLVMDNFNPNLVWFIGGFICLLTMGGFFYLHLKGKERFKAIPPDEAEILSTEPPINQFD